MGDRQSSEHPASVPPPGSPHSPSQDMATMVAHNNQPNMPSAGINKRYRPAPAKTFQCRGYGECRMVFSRSEHLARHIRKHTGERPFTCHCGKQFSRLDNLRQHAQTVHADKQEQNERMMRDLTSLHATMAAANKSGQPRGKRSQTTASSAGSGSGPTSPGATGPVTNHVKQEDDSQSVLPMHQRPGTSTGYEGSDHTGILYQAPSWHIQTSDMDRPTSRPTNNHSFREPGQSFLAPSSSHTSSAQSQSFLPFSSTYNFSLSDHPRDGRPGSSSSRPPTSTGTVESHPRSLPPLSSVVPQAIPPPSSQPQQLPSFSSTQHVLPFPAFRRPSTATRPGTAPAAYFGGLGLDHRSELSFLSYGRDMAAPLPASHSGHYNPEYPQSPSTGTTTCDSPFSFHPPALADSQPAAAAAAATQGSSPPNPRKRAFTGTDGPESGGDIYDYGSESRPQSRRLSVMELCNDSPAVLFLPGATGSRPSTSSGLVSSASALALIDRSPKISLASASGASPPLLSRVAQAAASAASTAPGGGAGGGEAPFGAGGVPAAPRRTLSSSSPATTTTTTVLSPIRGSPALSDAPAAAGFSPRSASSSYSPRSPTHAAAARGLQQSQSKPSSPSADTISRRGGTESEHDQVRISVPTAHSSPTPVGMRV